MTVQYILHTFSKQNKQELGQLLYRAVIIYAFKLFLFLGSKSLRIKILK